MLTRLASQQLPAKLRGSWYISPKGRERGKAFAARVGALLPELRLCEYLYSPVKFCNTRDSIANRFW